MQYFFVNLPKSRLEQKPGGYSSWVSWWLPEKGRQCTDFYTFTATNCSLCIELLLTLPHFMRLMFHNSSILTVYKIYYLPMYLNFCKSGIQIKLLWTRSYLHSKSKETLKPEKEISDSFLQKTKYKTSLDARISGLGHNWIGFHRHITLLKILPCKCKLILWFVYVSDC